MLRILSLECSAKAASAALFEDGKLLAEEFNADGKTHSETLCPAAENLLKKADLSFSDIDIYAITNGPGSFTGLRIGLAAVKGFAFLDKSCITLSTLEVIAEDFRDEEKEVTVLALMDARAGQFYTATFKAGNGEVARLTEDAALKGDEIYENIKQYNNVIAAGDGAKLFCSKFNDINCSNVYQNAVAVGKLAFKRLDYKMPAEKIAVNYLRKPQAEREREAKLKNSNI